MDYNNKEKKCKKYITRESRFNETSFIKKKIHRINKITAF